MGFGCLAPLPLRLGGSPQEGITASEHARLAADLTAVSRTSPLCSMLIAYDPLGSGSAVTLAYSGRNGGGLQSAPRVSGGIGVISIEFIEFTNSLGFSVDFSRYAQTGMVAEAYSVTTGDALSCVWIYESIYISVDAAVAQDIQVTVYGSTAVDIGDYGGHPLKRESPTEGEETYACTWYKILKEAAGSGYSRDDADLVACENKAHARALGTSQRISEMLPASSTPGGADALLGRWASLLGIQQGALSQWAVRQECELNFVGLNPVTHDTLEAGLAERLGSYFVSIVSNKGATLDPLSIGSYWPGYINGPGSLDMGPGVFSSARANINVLMDAHGMAAEDTLNKASRVADPYLSRIMPATSTWEPCESVGGFIIGTSRIGLAAI